jgi:ABC-type multidrug transport system fused ATPase/permease subunit
LLNLSQVLYAAVLSVAFWILQKQVSVQNSGDIGAFLLFYHGIEYKFVWLKRQYKGLVQKLQTAKTTIEFLKRKPTILNGTIESTIQGHFQFKNVSFQYPSRKGNFSSLNLLSEISTLLVHFYCFSLSK